MRDLLSNDSARPALRGIDGASLSFQELGDVVDVLAGQLAALGVRPGDSVAIVLPNGIPMAVCSLAVMACTGAAPLNPAYSEFEFAAYFEDLTPRVLVTDGSTGTKARSALGAGAVHVVLDNVRTGFRLADGGTRVEVHAPHWAAADQVALLLHTSGTTGKPKVVPLSVANLVASARNIAATLALGPADACLNPMPLFHIHGLVAGLLAPLASGGSAICAPGFDAFRFGDWLTTLAPTWYTAVPSIHQAVLQRIGRSTARLETSLRFVRSSSSPLPPTVMAGIEALFGVPVVEAYGMTEASHQIASNPLPPAIRKAGSVGLGGSVSVRVLDASGHDAPAGSTGEVTIRGASVMGGYLRAPAVNSEAFVDGTWLRTGDLGYLDDDGYLYLTGRSKELINRAGEKIAPREIDEALLSHPDVMQAISFAVPDSALGEDVAVAVVSRLGSDLDQRAVREHLRGLLAPHKIPRRVLFVEDIPKGPTGKVQRVTLATQLGITSRRDV